MARTSNDDYFYEEGTINEYLDNFAVYEDSGALVVHDRSNDVEFQFEAGGTLAVDGTQILGSQQSLSDNTTGSADGSLQAVGDTSAGDESGAINNNFKEIYEVLSAHGLIG